MGDVVEDGREVPIRCRVVVFPPAVASDPGAVPDAREGEAAVVLDRGRRREEEAAKLTGDDRQRGGQQQHHAGSDA